jgi:CheY-like chemotaxis protein
MGKRHKLLVVEDNHESQLIIKVVLRNAYDVQVACNEESATSLLKNEKFDLVLLDLNLNGEGNGINILKTIRSESNTNKLPVIVTTAYDLDPVDKKFFDENANGFVQKPFIKNNLLESINQVLNNK